MKDKKGECFEEKCGKKMRFLTEKRRGTEGSEILRLQENCKCLVKYLCNTTRQVLPRICGPKPGPEVVVSGTKKQ